MNQSVKLIECHIDCFQGYVFNEGVYEWAPQSVHVAKRNGWEKDFVQRHSGRLQAVANGGLPELCKQFFRDQPHEFIWKKHLFESVPKTFKVNGQSRYQKSYIGTYMYFIAITG